MRRRVESLVIVWTLSLWSPAWSLSLPPDTSSSPPRKRKPVERVAVIGTGIAGLSVAHALVNRPEALPSSIPQVSCFDARPGLDPTAGAGIQLNGGLAVLGQIRPSVQQAVLEAGLRQTLIQSRAAPWSENKPFEELLRLNLPQIVSKAGGAVAKELMDDQDELLWCSIMRGALQQALYDTLPRETRDRIAFNKNLVEIVAAEDGALCRFDDGTQAGPFDVVLGCDGIKSAVKEYIERGGRISVDASKREGAAAALYSGVRIRYAVRDGKASEPQERTGALTQYFGNGAYALDGIYGAGPGQPHVKSCFIVYLDKDYIGPFKKRKQIESDNDAGSQKSEGAPTIGENADWTQNVQKSDNDVAREEMLQQLRDCDIPEGNLTRIVAEADRFFELGVYFHNPFSFAGWSKEVTGTNGAVVALCGDAAHAMPPFLGQGSNQAIQDAYCLANKILEYNQNVTSSVDNEDEVLSLMELLKEYEKTRWPATFAITWKAFFLGYLETGGESGFYAKFRDLFFKTMGIVGVAEKILLGAAVPKV